MHPSIEETPVLIAGAGPAGLVAAATLARNGVGSLVVDSRPAPSRLPRANAINMAAMELFRSWGLEAEIREGDVDVVPQARIADTLAESEESGQSIEVGFPNLDQSGVLSPAPPAAVPQDHLEPILERYVRSLGPARVQRSVSVVGLEEEEDGMLVTLADAALGLERMVKARYVIGADGIRSTVRDALGIDVESSGPMGDRLAVLLRAPLWDVAGVENRYTIYFTRLELEPFFLPVGNPDRWVFGSTWDFEADPLETLTEDRVRDLVREGAGVRDLDMEHRARAARHLRGGARGAVPGRRRVPDRRRGSPCHASRRNRHEQRDPRRLRPRLEARLGPQGLGGRRARSIPTSRSAGRSRSTTHAGRWTRREPPAARTPRSIRSSAGGSGICGCRRMFRRLDLLGPGLTLFMGPEASREMDRARRGSSGRGPRPRRHDEPRDGNRCRWKPAGPSRRRSGGT